MNTKPSILAIVPYKIFPAQMGGQKGIAFFYKSFSKLVSLTCLTTKNNFSDENYPIVNILSNASYRYLNPFLFFQVKKISKEKGINYIIFEHPYFAWLIVLLRYFSNAKLVIHSHNIESERFKSIGKWWWKILWHYERMAYKHAHVLWFITDFDKAYAIEKYQIDPLKCETIQYGVDYDELPNTQMLIESRKLVCEKHEINNASKLILFNGTLSYKPNLDALLHILKDINPILQQSTLDYKILICGKGLPDELNNLNEYATKHVVYCGFVDDIDLYFKACDVFINPLQDGGGIKTKLVEALGFGKPCVSSMNGAIGVDSKLTANRLHIVEDNNWLAFSKAIQMALTQNIDNNNASFYNYFSWKNIAKKALESLTR